MSKRLHFHFSPSCTGKGNGNPLQCSCLENPRDRAAWWAAIYGVAQSWTRLKQLSSSSSSSGGNGISVELFQILKDDAVKVLHSICQQIWKTQQWPQDWKRLVFIPIPKKGNAKECSYYHTIALISHTSKVMLKILRARFQKYVNHKLPDVQVGFRKRRGTRDQIATIRWIMEKAREFQKNIDFCFIDYAKAFDCVDHNKV